MQIAVWSRPAVTGSYMTQGRLFDNGVLVAHTDMEIDKIVGEYSVNWCGDEYVVSVSDSLSQEPTMAEEKYTVMVGNVSDGLKAYGPFSLKEAEECMSGHSSPAIIMTLHPDLFVEKKREQEQEQEQEKQEAVPVMIPLLEELRDTLRTAARWVTAVEESLPEGTAAREEAFSLVNDLYGIANKYPANS
jgi:hypothetical protein